MIVAITTIAVIIIDLVSKYAQMPDIASNKYFP
jgi:hypothetical protein